MTEAWVKRSIERQDLLGILKRAVMEEEEETHNRLPYQFAMCRAIMQYLAERDDVEPGSNTEMVARQFFLTKVLPAIEEFARTPEEKMALVTELFKWECESISRHFEQPLRTQEAIEPEKVFDGHQTMDEVD